MTLRQKKRLTVWPAGPTFWGTLLLGLACLSGCGRSSSGPAGELVPASRPLIVETWPVGSQGPGQIDRHFSGLVRPRRVSSLGVKQLGRVARVSVLVGQQVSQGEVLVEMDTRQLEAQRLLAAAQLAESRAVLDELLRGPRLQEIAQSQARVTETRAQLALAQTKLQRSGQLRTQSALSQQEYDEARYQYEVLAAQANSAEQALSVLVEGTRSERLDAQRGTVAAAEARLQELEIQLEESRIEAPYDGMIQAKYIDEGAIVMPGQSILELVEVSAIEVHVGLPTGLVPELLGQRLIVEAGERQGEGLAARLAPVVDRQSRTQTLILELDRQEWPNLAIGDTVQVIVGIALPRDGHWVPIQSLAAATRGLWELYLAEPAPESEATATSAGGEWVIVRRQVELLGNYGPWAEVRGPLNAGDSLVVSGVQRLTAGQRIVVESSEQLQISEDRTTPIPSMIATP